MSSKHFHSSGLPENLWSSPFVMIHFGYPACCIQSLIDGSQCFSGVHWNTVEREEILCTEGGFAWCLDPFNSSCWISAVPLPHSQQPPCFFSEPVLIKELRVDPMYTQILRVDIKQAQKKRICVWT